MKMEMKMAMHMEEPAKVYRAPIAGQAICVSCGEKPTNHWTQVCLPCRKANGMKVTCKVGKEGGRGGRMAR